MVELSTGFLSNTTVMGFADRTNSLSVSDAQSSIVTGEHHTRLTNSTPLSPITPQYNRLYELQ
jgi:hypothetical protein